MQNSANRPISTAGKSRGRRGQRLAVERLEDRALLSASTTPDLAAYATIDRPHGTAAATLSIPQGEFTTAASGTTLYNIQVVADDGSRVVPASIQIRDSQGHLVFSSHDRQHGELTGRVALGLGNYSVQVRGQGNTTGALYVLARMVGDVDGNHRVDSSDLAAIQADLGARRGATAAGHGAPAYVASLDLNGDGRVTSQDLALAKRNLGASAQKVKLWVNLDPNALKMMGNGNLYVAYIVTVNGTTEYLSKYGILVPVKGTDDTVPINNVDYADYSNPLSDPYLTNGIDVSPSIAMGSTRVWISVAKPIYFQVLTSNGKPSGPVNGFVQPSLTNSSDVNYHTIFDFQEFSLSGGNLNGNLSQVDMFGLPMTLQFAAGTSATSRVGTSDFRNVIVNGLSSFINNSTLPASLKQGILGELGYRALSVKDYLSAYPALQASLTYFQPEINQLWQMYPNGTQKPLILTTTKATYSGQVTPDGMFTFTPNVQSLPAVKIAKPNSWDVFGSSGPLAPGNTEQGALAAQISAALNRGTALLPSGQWSHPVNQLYPPAGPANFYAEYWHSISNLGLAYGFDYDDVGGYSSDIAINNATLLFLTVYWNQPK